MAKQIQTVGSFTELPLTPPSLEDCEVVEIRLDAEFKHVDLDAFLQNCPQKKLYTARDIREGGAQDLPWEERIERLHQSVSKADYIDIELVNWGRAQNFREETADLRYQSIVSYHDFTKTPSSAELSALLTQAKETGADILKFAFMIHSLADIGRLQTLLLENQALKLSVMGMGAYAPVSRVLLAQSGSVLNYGYLGDSPTAPGQWSAPLLKKAIDHCTPLTE